MKTEAWPTGMTEAEALAIDRAAINLTSQLLPLLNGQKVQVITTVLVALVATVASLSTDPDNFCRRVAQEAIALGHDTSYPQNRPH